MRPETLQFNQLPRHVQDTLACLAARPTTSGQQGPSSWPTKFTSSKRAEGELQGKNVGVRPGKTRRDLRQHGNDTGKAATQRRGSVV